MFQRAETTKSIRVFIFMKRQFTRIHIAAWLLWMLIPAHPPPLHASQAARKLELKGRVLLPQGTLRPRRWITVNLLALGTPYYSRTVAQQDGRFNFKDLDAGTYTLLFLIPRVGQLARTVEITPSFSSAKGTVEKQFEFTPELIALLLRPEERATVSVRELKISYRARREFERAQTRLRDRDAEGAIKYLQNAINQSGEFLEAINSLGIIHFQRKEFAEAEKRFRQALDLDEEAFEPRLNLGGVLLTLGQAKEALAENERAYEAVPQEALAAAQLGLSYYLLNDYGQAIRYLDRTKELDPAHFTFPQMTLAQIFMRLGQTEDAVEEIEEFIRLHPDAPEVARARELHRSATEAGKRNRTTEADSTAF